MRRKNFERSPNYRAAFFRTHEPIFGNIYFCAYCGTPKHRKKITIDHLVPVSRAKHSWRIRRKLARRGIRNINDPQNLVPACEYCNKSKGAKTSSYWTIKGRIGSVQWLWIPRHILRLCVLCIMMSYAYTELTSILQRLH